ncbi:hypothetical protein FEE95_16495 [Maribacter algarum]|uniref:DUF4846 domain-containing protein n=2 Tax=Maribacter algarum (ex Zhang et al. 2020) TaxID=2578118 RepID=A0A5S3PRT1_9FLAO|nr:hypothetical protein FEE95_16495 [Maribacter algarum]
MSYTCRQKTPEGERLVSKVDVPLEINTNGNTIMTRFSLPKGYTRISSDSTSFSFYLRNLPLKPNGSLVTYYNGELKPNRNVYDAVVDLPIGKRDLHQCADAVMRLRAEYLFQNKKFDSIHFNFTNGFKADYANWRMGKRIIVKGNQVDWKRTSHHSDSPKDFWKYLEMVFSYAGTASLEKEMKPVSIEEMQIGDVFIQGGFPGHAVIIVDIAINQTTNEKVFLLAQSYMPAQEIQVLKNPNNIDLSPWYGVSEILKELRTPEWTFKKSALRRFSN